MAASKFPGFPLGLLHFLEELSRNNNKKWFDKHKARYESEVRGPAVAYIESMRAPLARFSPHFLAVPKKVGGSLMRIHRDVRFAKDKSPYKTNVGIQFRHERGRDVHAPGVYLHIEPEQAFLGVGLWRPDPPALAGIREAIDADPKAWKRVSRAKSFRTHFEPSGDSLKRPPKGYDAEHPMIEDLKRKDHIAICKLDHDQLLQPDIVKVTSDLMKKSKGYLQFLCEAVGVEF
ncbi:hypothetical protein Pla123a_32590 [Posidoniimonas polymericola]|uniref:TIGR02453 family protein n=1 Tax=Posidoniimonas polymericola TaxID=2528002 RepID=A0A5C5YFD8_9BACT|nr:DUF2461 domain-containing protein [Posidoniimonas polymericola]TWT74436.1 hypothetical protein Pla123a_32590 [Posidoniimonas polymericola]